MVTQTRKQAWGKRPYLYSNEETRGMNQQVYANTYTLHTGDWFEDGTEWAYSLHRTEEVARRFKEASWWAPTRRAREVFVSRQTLERITKPRGGVFVAMGD